MAPQTKTYPIVENAINLFGDWLNHRREMRELRDIDRSDFARIAHELSVTPAELDMFVRRGPHASDELPKLLNLLGIDPAALARAEPLLQRDMVRVCSACQQKARCDRELDAGTAGGHYEEYCPNAASIDGLGQLR
jgi:hypothetical protein